MSHRQHSTVTQEGVTTTQPGVSVSVTSFENTHTLNVARHYDNLTNRWGGLGRIKPLDCDGMKFASSYEAFEYAYQHGYIRDWFRRSVDHSIDRSAQHATLLTQKRGAYNGTRKLTKHLCKTLTFYPFTGIMIPVDQ